MSHVDVPRTLTHPKYRADIDGLRAVAVILVIGFHAFPDLFKSGFIGVDIFFVISGFLISSIIFNTLNSSGFSYKEFYARRIKRIFPALILVLITCIVLGYLYLLIDEYKSLGKNIAAGTIFISNFATWAEAGYFDTANYLKPLLHLWSLAIEEQFYIFWPILLRFLWRNEKKQHFLFVTLVVGIFSFCVNIVTSWSNPTANFYSPLSRFWELMIGGLLAYVSIFRSQYLERNSNSRSFAGLALIIFGLVFINQDMVYPGWAALFPTIGAFLLISAKPQAWINQRVLSRKLFVWIGLVSYPLYLWHWPLLAFARIIFGQDLSFYIVSPILVVSIILSWLTFAFVEKPIRSAKNVSKVIFLLVSIMVVILLYGILIVKTYGFPRRVINTKQHLYDPSLHESMKIPLYGTIFNDESCKKILGRQLLSAKDCRTNTSSPLLLFGGDSHAVALYSAIQSGVVDVPASVINTTGCPLYVGINTISHDCSTDVVDLLSVAKMRSVKYVFIVNTSAHVNNPKSNSDYVYNNKILTKEDAFIFGYSNLFDKLFALNKNIVFILDIPLLPVSPKDCVQRSIFVDNSKKDCGVDFDTFQASRLEYLNLVYRLKEKYPKLIIYDASKNLCNQIKCLIKDDNDYFYADNNHLTVYGSNKVLSNMLKELNIAGR